MASTLKDNVLHWRKKLERTSEEYTLLTVIHRLSKVPITIELLQETGIGKVIRNLAKQSGKVGEKAKAVLINWRKALASGQKLAENSLEVSHAKHGSTKKDSSSKDSVLEASHAKHISTKKDSSSKDRMLEASHAKHVSTKKGSSSKDSVPSTKEYETKKEHKKKKSIESKHGQKLSHSHSSKEKDCTNKVKTTYVAETSTNGSHERNIDYSPTIDYTSNGDEDFSDMTETIRCYGTVDSSDDNLVCRNDTLNKDDSDIYGKRKHSKKLTLSDGIPESKKRKIESSQLDVSQDNKTMLKEYDPNSCKKKDKKSHGSSVQSSDKTEKSRSHNHSNKNPQKLKSEKVKKTTDSEKKRHSELKKTLQMQSTDAFTSSEVRFEDCLSFNDIVPVKKKKSSKPSLEKKGKYVSGNKKYEAEPSKPKKLEKSVSSSKTCKTDKKVKVEQTFSAETSQNILTKGREIVNASTLSQPQTYYRPLPQRSFDFFQSKRKVLSNEDAIKFTSSKREKTVVYSGRKNLFFTEVPSLFESCTRILIENIDAIEYLGGVPYYLLKPVLERCTPQQLDNIEHYNPNLLDDCHELWEVHCKKDFRTQKPQENETWRDLYWRAFEERERKLKTLTENISASMSKSSNTGRSVKLTYVDTFVKPPRDVARKQMKNGTGLPVNHTVKAGPPSKASPRPTAPAINSAVASASKVDIHPIHPVNPKKPKIAPLMAKTLKSMKQCFRR